METNLTITKKFETFIRKVKDLEEELYIELEESEDGCCDFSFGFVELTDIMEQIKSIIPVIINTDNKRLADVAIKSYNEIFDIMCDPIIKHLQFVYDDKGFGFKDNDIFINNNAHKALNLLKAIYEIQEELETLKKYFGYDTNDTMSNDDTIPDDSQKQQYQVIPDNGQIPYKIDGIDQLYNIFINQSIITSDVSKDAFIDAVKYCQFEELSKAILIKNAFIYGISTLWKSDRIESGRMKEYRDKFKHQFDINRNPEKETEVKKVLDEFKSQR